MTSPDEKLLLATDVAQRLSCVFDLAQVLFALNERYYMNEKGAVDETEAFELVPEGFAATAHQVLGHPGRSADELAETLKRLRALLAGVTALVQNYTDNDVVEKGVLSNDLS